MTTLQELGPAYVGPTPTTELELAAVTFGIGRGQNAVSAEAAEKFLAQNPSVRPFYVAARNAVRTPSFLDCRAVNVDPQNEQDTTVDLLPELAAFDVGLHWELGLLPQETVDHFLEQRKGPGASHLLDWIERGRAAAKYFK